MQSVTSLTHIKQQTARSSGPLKSTCLTLSSRRSSDELKLGLRDEWSSDELKLVAPGRPGFLALGVRSATTQGFFAPTTTAASRDPCDTAGCSWASKLLRCWARQARVKCPRRSEITPAQAVSVCRSMRRVASHHGTARHRFRPNLTSTQEPFCTDQLMTAHKTQL